MIEKIINKNKDILGENATFTKIPIGFTNEVYDINGEFIVKIYKDEEKYLGETSFFKQYKSEFIPKLLKNESENGYYCSIVEKIEGVNLYSVWHTLSETKREFVISKLCAFMKLIHKSTTSINWLNYNLKEANAAYTALNPNIFTKEEHELILNALNSFSYYLSEKESAGLIHADLHFDNVFYSENSVKIIDYDRAIIAPKDFELDITDRMIRKPYLFANEEDEAFIKVEHYSKIYEYINIYYKELLATENLSKRLSIYNLIYNLYNLYNYPKLAWLKEEVLSSAKNIIT